MIEANFDWSMPTSLLQSASLNKVLCQDAEAFFPHSFTDIIQSSNSKPQKIKGCPGNDQHRFFLAKEKIFCGVCSRRMKLEGKSR